MRRGVDAWLWRSRRAVRRRARDSGDDGSDDAMAYEGSAAGKVCELFYASAAKGKCDGVFVCEGCFIEMALG